MAARCLDQVPFAAGAFAAAGPEVRRAAIDAVAAVFLPHVHGDEVRMGAATWVVTARR